MKHLSRVWLGIVSMTLVLALMPAIVSAQERGDGAKSDGRKHDDSYYERFRPKEKCSRGETKITTSVEYGYPVLHSVRIEPTGGGKVDMGALNKALDGLGLTDMNKNVQGIADVLGSYGITEFMLTASYKKEKYTEQQRWICVDGAWKLDKVFPGATEMVDAGTKTQGPFTIESFLENGYGLTMDEAEKMRDGSTGLGVGGDVNIIGGDGDSDWDD